MDKRYSNLPEPFCYYRAIFESDHFHFGLWSDDNTSLSLESAQGKMFDHLLSFFPPPPAEVLDVGCGLGLSASLLAKKGYKVTAIAPSAGMIQYAQLTYGENGVLFKEEDFFSEAADVFARGRYDVLLLQESAQYLSSLHDAMKKAWWLLRDNGFLIIGDEVCYDKSIKAETYVHLARDFRVALPENGFRIMENEKVGKRIFPTYDFVIEGFRKNSDKIMLDCPGKDTQERIEFYSNGWKRQKDWNLQGKTGYEIFVARKDSFTVVPYSAGDEEKILPTFNEVFGVNRTPAHWLWKFLDNPYGSHKISEVFSGEGNLVAHYAGYPVPFYCDVDGAPERFLALQIGDTMTRPEVRRIGRGKTSLLARTAQHFYAKYCEGVVPFTYGFNTGTIKKLGERFLGYQYIDPVPYRIKNVKTSSLRPESLFERIFSGYSVKFVDSFGEAFDSLFEESAPTYNFLIKRESRYLVWRYRDCPDRAYMIVTVRMRGKLVGWSVFLRKDSRLIWGDALFDRKHPMAVECLLRRVLNNRLCEGIETVEGWFSSNPFWWNQILDRLGFELATEPSNLFPCFFLLTDAGWIEKLQNSFYYTMGDSDLF